MLVDKPACVDSLIHLKSARHECESTCDGQSPCGDATKTGNHVQELANREGGKTLLGDAIRSVANALPPGADVTTQRQRRCVRTAPRGNNEANEDLQQSGFARAVDSHKAQALALIQKYAGAVNNLDLWAWFVVGAG